MPKIDLTVTITSLIAIIALIVPVFTTLLNNHHQEKMKRLELHYSKKVKAIEHYINSAGKLLHRNTVPNFSEYGEAKGIIYLYSPSNTWKIIDKFDSFVISGNLQEAEQLFHSLCKELSKTLEK